MPFDSDGYTRFGEESITEDTLFAGPPRRKEKPWLVPTNRKLRHLSGISLRNLCSSSSSTTTTTTITTTTPTAIAGTPGAPLAEASGNNNNNNSNENEDPRKSPQTRRRRSTKTFGLGEIRRWEGVVANRRGDVFFSLHVAGAQEPVYISEIVGKSMNPDFQAFNLNDCGPWVSRMEGVTVKVWWRGAGGELWQLLLQAEVCLSGLSFVGRSLENWSYPFPENCVLFRLEDGFYTSFWDGGKGAAAAAAAAVRAAAPAEVNGAAERPHGVIPTSSYDTLMKLSNLTDCIHDATLTTSLLTSQISNILSDEPSVFLPRAVSQATDRLQSIGKAVTIESRRLEAARRRLHALHTSLQNRRDAMRTGRETQSAVSSHLADAKLSLSRSRLALSSTREALSAQRKRIVSTLSSVFPIEPHSSGSPLAFTILNLHLPSENHEDYLDPEISAALGYAAQLVYLLSYYLSAPLRYPVKVLGSKSFVKDDISVIQGARTFPLWMRGSVYYRFEYAVFLLNKDVQQLMSAVGLHCVDIRHTLANLKSLMLFIGGSDSEIEETTAPGRGFLSVTTLGGSRAATPLGYRPLLLAEEERRKAAAGPVMRKREGFGAVAATMTAAAARPYAILAGRGGS